MKINFLVLFLFFVSILPAQKRAFSIEDLYKIKTVADPQMAPDGKSILFTVTESQLKEGKSNSAIHVISSEGTVLRKLTGNSSSSWHPRWNPDGKSFLFLSSRSGGTQLWVLPMDGGEAKQLTKISGGVSDPVWLPDGKRILFNSDVYPECGADDACNKKIDDAKDKGAIKAHIADRLLYRHWTSWKDGKRTHTFILTVDTEKLNDMTPGDFDSPGFSLGAGSYAVSPNGDEICVVSNRDPLEAESTNNDLILIPAAGGKQDNITKQNKAYDGDPAYSPDGRCIAYRCQSIPTFEADCFRIALYDRSKKTSEIITKDFDNWVGTIEWAPDSRSIFFTAQSEGHVPLYSVDIATKKIVRVADEKTIDAFDLSPDGKYLAVTRRSVGDPVELFLLGADGKSRRQLTFFNKNLADSVDIRPAEEMWISSPTGRKIHTFIVKPHDFDPAKKYPLIVNVHGGPQSQWADAFRGDWQVYPGAGYVVAFPNPHGSTGYGQEFTAAISKDWNGKVYKDVMAVTDELEKLPYVDKERIGAMGWSYGGYMMMWMEGHTKRFKAIAAMMGVYNLKAMHGATEELWFPEWDLGGAPWESDLYEKMSPNKFVKNFSTPCLVITGELDYRVPYTQSLEFFTDLQKMKVPSRLIVFPNDGHWPNPVKSMPLYYNAHLDWFHTYLGGEPAPYDMTKMIRNQAFE